MKITGAKAVVECLLEQGVDTVFGYPGGMILPLYDAMQGVKNLKHILTVHEQGAAHAADGYARASGKVGVCIATSGPGATNLVTGLATAFMDSVPVVAITGQVETSLLGRDAFQEVDIVGITMPITKHNFQIKDIKKLAQTIRLAFKIAKSGRQGPVLIDIPRDILNAEINFDAVPATMINGSNVYSNYGECEKAVAEAVEMINKAKKPVVVVGGGVNSAGASAEVKAFVEKYNLPVVSTLMGLGAFPRRHPQSLGLTGLHGLKPANNAVHEADVVIAIGSRFSDRLTGNRDKYSNDKYVIHIDIDPAEIDKNVMAGVGLPGEIKAIINMINKFDNTNNISSWWADINAWRLEYKVTSDDKYLNVPWLMNHISESTKDEEVVFVTDVGQHQMWAAQNLQIDSPRTWLTSGGLGAMGFGLPAALGAQLAQPQKRVISFSGDGGIKMTGNELFTIVQNCLPVIAIIINNSCLGMIRQLQHVYYDRRYTSCCLATEMDFAMYAKSFGIESVSVETPKDFITAFNEAWKKKTPQVIVVNVNKEFVAPMTKPGANINQFVDL